MTSEHTSQVVRPGGGTDVHGREIPDLTLADMLAVLWRQEAAVRARENMEWLTADAALASHTRGESWGLRQAICLLENGYLP